MLITVYMYYYVFDAGPDEPSYKWCLPCIVVFKTMATFPFVDFVELEIEFFAPLVFFFGTE